MSKGKKDWRKQGLKKMADDKELINMKAAEREVATGIAILEKKMNSALITEQEKIGLVVARAQLFGSFALVRIHNHLLETESKLDDKKVTLS